MKGTKKKALVSIIIPVFNAEKTIERAVRSVKNQTYKNWELLLVDDCSSDNSLKVIKKLESRKIRIIRLEHNSGPAVSRNAGLDAARGDYVAFLDADDFWDAEKLEKQIEFMEEKNCAFSFTSYKFTNEDGRPIKTHSMNVPEKLDYKGALKNTTIFTSTVMFNLNKIDKMRYIWLT
jgi:teichuronic acid biosynthesis glycosyltransferase TuaG